MRSSSSLTNSPGSPRRVQLFKSRFKAWSSRTKGSNLQYKIVVTTPVVFASKGQPCPFLALYRSPWVPNCQTEIIILTTPTEMNTGFVIISEAIFSMRGGMVAENIRFCLNRGKHSTILRTCNKVNKNIGSRLVCREREKKIPAVQIPSAEDSQPRQEQTLGCERDQCLQL